MFSRFKKLLKWRKQKGQSLAFVGITIPIVFAFVGMAVDFGWMYLNQSTLQSAADAAAFAGANKGIMDEKSLSDYGYATAIATTNSSFQTLVRNNTLYSRNTEEEDQDAKQYAQYALEGWNHSKAEIVETDSDRTGKVKFERFLFGPDSDDYDAIYYTVQLTEKMEHLFPIMDFFGIGTMDAVAVSAVKVSHNPNYTYGNTDYPHGPSIYQQMKMKEQSETYSTWENVKVAKGYDATAANDRSVLTGGTYYASGNLYRTEMSTLDGNAFASSRGNPYVRSISADGSSYSGQYGYDDLFIDFQGEINSGVWQGIDYDLDASTIKTGAWAYGDSLAGNLQYSYRVHMPICINTTYPVRVNDGKRPPDSLYAFIEQEPITRKVIQSDGDSYDRGNMSSVRQLIISNNVANFDSNSNRPWIFFYEGPEVPTYEENAAVYDSDKKTYIGVRPYLPLILNLNADFRGVVFCPQNPIIINGNGHTMQGFVIAESFKRLKTAADFESEGYVKTTYNNTETYVKESSLAEIPSNISINKVTSLSSVSSYVKVKVNLNNTWVEGYVQSGQWYSRTSNPNTSNYAQINYNGDTNKYSLFTQLYIPVFTYNGKQYAVKADEKFYCALESESVTYSGSVTARTITSGGKTVYQSSGNNITQSINKMYVSGTAYTETQSYKNANDVVKTKTAYIHVGDVQYMNIGATEQSKDEDGNYKESPNDASTFTDYDKLRYTLDDFNLSSSSYYNSFYNVSLVNYSYLAKNESSSATSVSQDMFFTTERAKLID